MALRFLPKTNISHTTTEWLFTNLRFVLFLGFLAVVYIANAHFAERNVRRIQQLQREIKELKWDYISIKSETMYKSMQSQIDKNLESTGLELAPEGPKVIENK